jgi:GNAT superfamily N-acetyltransferase
MATWCAVGSAEAAPPVDAQFTYTFERSVGSGGGEYAGYTDHLRSEGAYTIVAVEGDVARVHAIYEWSYSSSEGKHERGHEDREVSFRLSDRRYLGPRTDLDEWDQKDATQLAVWFWIPPEVQVGQTVAILDEPYVVVRRDAVFDLGDRDVAAIEVFHEGTDTRNDDYGTLGFTYADRYFFDPTTGMVIAEDYTEQDSGTFRGLSASFGLEESFRVGRTTYPLAVEWTPRVLRWARPLGIALGSLLLVVLLFRWFRSLPTSVNVDGLGPIKVRWVGPKDMPLPPVKPGMTQHFGPHVADLVHKAHRAKDRVATAVAATGELVGIGIVSREAQIATILSPSTEVTEGIRKHLAVQDFFSEVRHPVPDHVRGEFQMAGLPLPTQHAYNVFETYQVLAVAPPPAPAYDTAAVSRLAPEDVPAIEDVSRKVYKVPSTHWLRAQLDGGDLGFVARIDGAIVGFALASLQGTQGRVHTNTLLPEHRGKGLGKELMRARLRTLSDLGAERVMTEIADWNLPSLEIARSFGFAPVGTMVVETSRTQRIKKEIVRR